MMVKLDERIERASCCGQNFCDMSVELWMHDLLLVSHLVKFLCTIVNVKMCVFRTVMAISGILDCWINADDDITSI